MQSREALNHLAYTIAAGGSGPRFHHGAMKQPSKMPGRPNSRGRLSLNLLTDPERSTKIRGIQFPGKTGKGFNVVLHSVSMEWVYFPVTFFSKNKKNTVKSRKKKKKLPRSTSRFGKNTVKYI